MDRQTHIHIFVLMFVLKICLTEEVKENLTAIVGASITFPAPVKERGFFLLGPKTIALIYKSELEIEEVIYTNRLHWSNTGFFTITDLQKNDSGVYTVESKKGTVFLSEYALKVYDPVSPPVVTTLNVSADSCTLQCSVNKTEQTTVSWFRGEDIVTRSSSEVLPLKINQSDFNSEYQCVAANPADTKTFPVDLTTACKRNNTGSTEASRGINYIHVLIPIVLTVLLLLFAVIVKTKCLSKKRSLQTQDSVIYTEVNILDRGKNQRPNLPDSSGNIDRSQLTTVYDQIEAHRITPVYSNCGQEIT